jgi:hypothetical protein
MHWKNLRRGTKTRTRFLKKDLVKAGGCTKATATSKTPEAYTKLPAEKAARVMGEAAPPVEQVIPFEDEEISPTFREPPLPTTGGLPRPAWRAAGHPSFGRKHAAGRRPGGPISNPQGLRKITVHPF